MSQKYSVIYADPPWYFHTFSPKGRGRSADAHYDVLDIDSIKRIPVADYAAKDAALFLWATDPLLPKAIEVMNAWGFQYKTIAFCWVKLNKKVSSERFDLRSFFTGLGYWTRANQELCLLGTRGSPQRKNFDVKRLIVSPRREHSRKPDEVYERIERLLDGPYLELFARNTRTNWCSEGNQVGLFDSEAPNTRRWPSVRPPDTQGKAA